MMQHLDLQGLHEENTHMIEQHIHEKITTKQSN